MLYSVIIELTLHPVFAGKEPNKALGQSSLKPEDCISDYSTLSDSEKKVLNDWHTFFSKRYNIVGRLQAEEAANL
jgi:membrane-associated progesterone receptor component